MPTNQCQHNQQPDSRYNVCKTKVNDIYKTRQLPHYPILCPQKKNDIFAWVTFT
jgi:hypothetical protein